jgi:processing peptidase subunit beta
VATEKHGGQTATVGVWCGAGSRHENLENSGAAFLTCNMIDRGSHSLSAHEVNAQIEEIGAKGYHTHEREYTTHGISSLKKDIPKTLALLGDIVCNTAFSPEEFQIVKSETESIHENNHTQFKKTLMENVHFNIYRDHMMGQPVRGDRDNLKNVTLDDVKEFHRTHYHGENVMVIATGDVDHQQVVDMAEQHFSSLPKQAAAEISGGEKSIFNPGLMQIRDDEMNNANTGVFYDAPSMKHQDYYSFLLLQHIFGSYRLEANSGHLNDVAK